MYISPLTNLNHTHKLFIQKPVPVFQNKVYPVYEHAKSAQKKEVILAQCLDTGFVFSAAFDMSILTYDENYQNEQSNSPYFQSHLESVLNLLKEKKLLAGKILEIGCGKGHFLNMLLNDGYDVLGIDPTYEGDSDKIIKEYYGEKHSHLNAELIILRHTLEHLPRPHDFLKMIAKSNNYKGKIYIEIPTFEWIVQHNAIEDIFYEHCNYFTATTIKTLFQDCAVHYLFNSQYLGIIADLSNIKKEVLPLTNTNIEHFNIYFQEKLYTYENLLKEHKNIAIWGAGAKGSTFLNLLDPTGTIVKCVIDINPKKQNNYIGGTGHKIISPTEIENYEIDTILVMNINYLEEIKQITNKKIIAI